MSEVRIVTGIRWIDAAVENIREAERTRVRITVPIDTIPPPSPAHGRCDECPRPGYHHGKACWVFQEDALRPAPADGEESR